MSALDDALRLAGLGWEVFPCGTDKAPLTRHGFKDASADETDVRRWWAEHPDALVGVALPPGTWAADVDTKKTNAPPPGLSVMQRTRSKGWHGYPRLGDARQGPRPWGDVKAGGAGYLIAWQPAKWPAVADLVAAPTAELPLLDGGRERLDLGSEEAECFLEGGRESALVSAAGQMRMIGMTANEVHAALVVMNRDRCRPPLDRSAVVRIARSAATWERGLPAPVVRYRSGSRGGSRR